MLVLAPALSLSQQPSSLAPSPTPQTTEEKVAEKPMQNRAMGRISGGPVLVQDVSQHERSARMRAPEVSQQPFEITLHLLECVEVDEDMPEALANMGKNKDGLFEHTACGGLKARTLLKTEKTAKVGDTLEINEQETAYIARTDIAVGRDGTKFVYVPQSTQDEADVGVRMVLTMLRAVEGKIGLSVYAQVLDRVADGEEMILLGDGQLYINPKTRVDERIMTALANLAPGENDIISGEALWRTRAPEGQAPTILPEAGRLWLEIGLQKP